MKKTDSFIHGRCERTGLVKHWPKNKYYVKEGYVYQRGGNKVLGVQDDSVYTEDARRHIEGMQEADSVRDPRELMDEAKRILQEIEEKEKAEQAAPLVEAAGVPEVQQEPAAEEVIELVTASAATVDEETPSPIPHVQKEEIMNQAQNATNANESTTKEDTTMNNAANDTTATSSTQAAKPAAGMSKWSFAWRITMIFAVLIAAIAAIVLGLQYGLAYVAALGLGATATLMYNALIGAMGVALCWLSGRCADKALENLAAKTHESAFESELAGATAQAAAV